ncbi:hypothetical protein BJX66DRAFT_303149 [Aspergillus keveii]|uniref:Uncharacterized protein n=1 Tax=Aspergillus keveii TaxID=714993 RepID=A0ABR4G6Y8_9EURO
MRWACLTLGHIVGEDASAAASFVYPCGNNAFGLSDVADNNGPVSGVFGNSGLAVGMGIRPGTQMQFGQVR